MTNHPAEWAREIVTEIIRSTPIAGDWDRTKAIFINEAFVEKLAQALVKQRDETLEEACSVVFGQCDSDNVAQRTVDAIRQLKSKQEKSNG